MKSSLQAYWLSLTFIARDIALLYKNFFHWNASKIAIWSFAMLFGTVVSLPAIGLILWAGYTVLQAVPEASLSLFTTSGTLDESLLAALTGHTWILVGVAVLMVIIIAIYVFAFTYAYLLEINLYDSYLANKKLPILKNLYLSKYHLTKFLGILSWSSLYILPPLAVGIGILLVLFMLTSFGVLDQANQTHSLIIGGVSFVGFAACIVWMTILAIRLAFGYMMLLDKPQPSKSARSYIWDSFALTKGRLREIVALFIPFMIVISFIGGIIGTIDNNILIDRSEKIINDIAKADPANFVDDHSYVKQNFLNAFALDQNDIAQIIAINNSFNPKTDGIDREYLEVIFPYLDLWAIDPDAWKIDLGFAAVEFLLIEGVMAMVYFSIFTLLRKTGTTSKATAVKQPAAAKSAPEEKTAKTEEKPAPKAEKKTAAKPKTKKAAAEAAPKKKAPAKKKSA